MASCFKRDVNDLQKKSDQQRAPCMGWQVHATPVVPGVSVGEGRLCTPAASISFGVCASRSGSACVKQAACKAVNIHGGFIMYSNGNDKAVSTIV